MASLSDEEPKSDKINAVDGSHPQGPVRTNPSAEAAAASSQAAMSSDGGGEPSVRKSTAGSLFGQCIVDYPITPESSEDDEQSEIDAGALGDGEKKSDNKDTESSEQNKTEDSDIFPEVKVSRQESEPFVVEELRQKAEPGLSLESTGDPEKSLDEDVKVGHKDNEASVVQEAKLSPDTFDTKDSTETVDTKDSSPGVAISSNEKVEEADSDSSPEVNVSEPKHEIKDSNPKVKVSEPKHEIKNSEKKTDFTIPEVIADSSEISRSIPGKDAENIFDDKSVVNESQVKTAEEIIGGIGSRETDHDTATPHTEESEQLKDLRDKPEQEAPTKSDTNNSAIPQTTQQECAENSEKESISEMAIDNIETSSHGSAEFHPELDQENVAASSKTDEKTEESPEDPSTGSDKDVLLRSPERKDEEAMDVDEEESSNQGVEDVALTPAIPDAEDGDSLAETEYRRPPPVSKPRIIPVTQAFMDENSLSMDCVLAISSTVPEGDVSMDMSLGGISVQSLEGNSIQSSSNAPTPAKRSRPTSVMSGLEPDPDLDEDGNFPAETLFEYQWPQDGGEWYMLQEQLSEYLQVKSFKRKYPELFRRTADKSEKEFLRERGVVTETQSDLGLTAVKSEEVYDLMHKDYADKYREYAQVLHEKERQNINNKHKEYEVPKLEKGKMGIYIKKAVKAAADFNAQFQRERREERKAYFDLQTFSVHYPAGRYKKLPPKCTKPDPYSVALIPGQFQDYYCRYTSDELKYLPLNTTIFDPPKVMASTLVKPNTDQESSELDDSTEEKVGSASDGESDGDDGSSDSDGSDSEAEDSKSKEEPLAEPLPEEKCRICNSVDAPPPEKKPTRGKKVKQEKPSPEDQEMIKCSECGTVGHPSCLDLTNAMVSVIRTYPWQCMECKTCVECMDPYDEDKMMFCDRCDRGYHTFCVGLRSIPTGRWECKSCKGADTPRSRKRASLAK